MNTQPQGGRPLEDDPTGVRALLHNLPEPGPMPDDLVARISASLAEAQEERASGTRATRLAEVPNPWTLAPGAPSATSDGDEPATVATRLVPMPSVSSTPSPSSASPASAPAAPRDELAARRARRNRRVTALVGVAAALALVGAGGAALTQMQDSSVTAEPVSAASSAGSDAAPASDYRVVASGKDYHAATFSGDAKQLSDGEVSSNSESMSSRPDAAAAQKNPTSLAPCVKGLLDDLMAKPDSVVVDFAKYEGQDAMIVVIKRDGKSTAWAVRSTCTVNRTDVLAGPTPVGA